MINEAYEISSVNVSIFVVGQEPRILKILRRCFTYCVTRLKASESSGIQKFLGMKEPQSVIQTYLLLIPYISAHCWWVRSRVGRQSGVCLTCYRTVTN
jgi:hypothetical protein